MTERERRQARLLAVRRVQANLVTMELQRLNAEQQADAARLRVLCQFDSAAKDHLTQAMPEHEGWLLACAEQSLAAVTAARTVVSMQSRTVQIHAQAQQEQQARIRREQVARLCERTSLQIHAEVERRTQASLDDLFSAARIRTLALARHGRRECLPERHTKNL